MWRLCQQTTNDASAGFVYALTIAGKLITIYRYGIVIGAEVLFGDGAGGVLVESSHKQSLVAEDLTMHAFRQIHASLLFDSGASMKEIQKSLGHLSFPDKGIFVWI